jgi:hypothetical protein
MGKPEAGGTVDASKVAQANRKRRRIHPVRWVARLVLGKRGKKIEKRSQGEEKEPICRGPSVWHNLLPFLEPLFAVDPKLLFIEDHILGRSQSPSDDATYNVPRSLNDLQQRVEEASLPCDCDECTPKLYRISHVASHGAIKSRDPAAERRKAKFSYAHQSVSSPGPGQELKLRFHGDYEAMSLVRHHAAWLDSIYLHPSADKTTPAVQHLHSLMNMWNPHITALDMRQSTSVPQLQRLFTQLNTIFFSGLVPAHNPTLTNGFSFLPETRADCFGTSYFNPIIGTQILLHPTLYRQTRNASDPAAERMRNRLGTLLHEMCHAFLKAYTCRSCPMHDACIGKRGHGRAWQVLAAKMEQVATKLMGGNVEMGRFPSLLRDMEGHGRLPSGHDLEVFGFGCVHGNAEQSRTAQSMGR